MWNLSTEFSDTAFICSPGNKMAMNSSISEMNEIITNAKFNSHILFSTKILDNGVNLRDKQLKHIVNKLGLNWYLDSDDECFNIYEGENKKDYFYFMIDQEFHGSMGTFKLCSTHVNPTKFYSSMEEVEQDIKKNFGI